MWNFGVRQFIAALPFREFIPSIPLLKPPHPPSTTHNLPPPVAKSFSFVHNGNITAMKLRQTTHPRPNNYPYNSRAYTKSRSANQINSNSVNRLRLTPPYAVLLMILCCLVWTLIAFVSASADDFTGLKACPDEEIKMGEEVLNKFLDNPSDSFRADEWCPVWSSRKPSYIDPRKDFDDMDEEEQKKHQRLIYEYDRRTFCCELPLKIYQYKNHLTSEFAKGLVLVDIANSRDPRIVPLLEDIIKSDISPELRMNATNELCRLDVKSQAVISNAINDNDIRVRGVAAGCLLRWGYEDKALFVMERIASGEEKQSYFNDITRDRERIDLSRGKMPNPPSNESIHRDHSDFQNSCIRNLGEYGKDAAIMLLCKLLDEADNQEIQEYIIKVLRRTNNPKAVDCLTQHK